jgi:hypothetical protein
MPRWARQVPADALRRVVERLRHDVNLTESNQPKQAISQIFSLD